MNRATFTGNLARDPESKVMQNGKTRTTFTIAVQRTYTNTQGAREADFIQIIAYDKNADLVARYLAKGRKILAETHVKTGSYDKDGKKIYTTEFILDRVEFLFSGQRDGDAPAQGQSDGYTPPPAGPEDPQHPGFNEVEDDDLPF